jgi:type II secretory pathway component PulK
MKNVSASESRQGSALLLVLAVLVSCVALVGGMQQHLYSRTQILGQEMTEVELRGALILGLQEGMKLWSEDEDLTVDHAGEDWAKPRNWMTSSGVELTVQLRDAQDRLNINHLTLPVSENSVRTPMDMLEELFRLTETEVNREAWEEVQTWMTLEEPWFASVDQLRMLAPEVAEWSRVDAYLVALPRPQRGMLPVNLNTVDPMVLRAMTGSQLGPWVDSVVQAREGEPIRNVESLLRFLPPQIQGLVSSAVSVQSDYVELRAVATYRHTERILTAWLHRESGGNVEIVQCQW